MRIMRTAPYLKHVSPNSLDCIIRQCTRLFAGVLGFVLCLWLLPGCGTGPALGNSASTADGGLHEERRILPQAASLKDRPKIPPRDANAAEVPLGYRAEMAGPLAGAAQPVPGTPVKTVIDGELPDFEGAAHGFPTLRELDGKKLADGEFTQWLENERLHVRINYELGATHHIEEKAVFRQKPQLVQEEWSWRELRDGKVYRQFEVAFGSGRATAEKWYEKKLRRWSEDVKVEPGRTFAGFGFTLAIKSLRERLIKGEKVELKAIGFTPKPRVVAVVISHGGLDQMSMSGRILRGDRFVIHPKVPWIAKPFVDVPDTRIWLINPPPVSFLRFEGPLAEASDPVIRVDLLPGNESGPAKPFSSRGQLFRSR